MECLRAVLSEEGAVNLECKVIGVPQPVLKWYKDGVELKPGDIHRITSGEVRLYYDVYFQSTMHSIIRMVHAAWVLTLAKPETVWVQWLVQLHF